jgi:hypothetical protein
MLSQYKHSLFGFAEEAATIINISPEELSILDDAGDLEKFSDRVAELGKLRKRLGNASSHQHPHPRVGKRSERQRLVRTLGVHENAVRRSFNRLMEKCRESGMSVSGLFIYVTGGGGRLGMQARYDNQVSSEWMAEDDFVDRDSVKSAMNAPDRKRWNITDFLKRILQYEQVAPPSALAGHTNPETQEPIAEAPPGE